MPNEKIHILLVDDDNVDCELIYRHLDDDHKLKVASTGWEGLKVSQVSRVDCVLLDYWLPDSDGVNILLRFIESGLPVVVLTGEANPQVIVQAMQAGADDYLVKNQMTRPRLEQAINNAIEKGNLRRQLQQKQHKLELQAAILKEKNTQIRELASKLPSAEQKERHRIAQVLHDELQQMLFSLKLHHNELGKTLPSYIQHEVQPITDDIGRLADRAIHTTRSLAVELSPPTARTEDMSLTFKWLAQWMENMHNLCVHLTVPDRFDIENHTLRELTFRTTRELPFNIVKHAGTADAQLELTCRDNCFQIRISDEGIGFDVNQILTNGASNGWGLSSVQERLKMYDGDMRVESAPGRGTRFTITLPLSQTPAPVAV